MNNLIQEVRAALQAATPGPWEAEGKEIWRRGESYMDNIGGHIWITDIQHKGNRELVANSPTWLQQLSDRLETAERQRDEAVKALEEILENTDPNDWYYGGIHKDASETLKRIKGENG